jgi:ketosteroid isomerase-like protein
MSSGEHRFVQQLQAAFLRGDPLAAGKQLEQTNVTFLARMYGYFLNGDLEAVLDGLDEQVDWHVAGPSTIPFTGHVRGRSEVRRLLEQGMAPLERHEIEVEELVAQGEFVTLVAYERGLYQLTGLPYEGYWVQLFTIRDQKIVRFREYFDSAIFTGTAEQIPQGEKSAMALANA